MDPNEVKLIAQITEAVLNKLSDGAGGLLVPYKIRRRAQAEAEATVVQAKAQADAAIIHADAENEIAERRQRAMHRMEREQVRQQQNMEAIVGQALPQLTAGADPTQVEDDWITNFLDRCRRISDEQMRTVWARVLASEFNKPGSFSRRTVNFVDDLGKLDCELFTRLCQLNWKIGDHYVPLILDHDAPIYHGVTFEALSHLESIGLIHLAIPGSQHTLMDLTKKTASYFGSHYMLQIPAEMTELPVGTVRLTRVGQELAPISGARPLPEFLDYMLKLWAHLLKPNAEAPASGPDVTSGEPAVD